MNDRIFSLRTDVNACECTPWESILKVESGRKILCRTGESNLRQRRASPMLYQLSYIPAPKRHNYPKSHSGRLTNWISGGRGREGGNCRFGIKPLLPFSLVSPLSQNPCCLDHIAMPFPEVVMNYKYWLYKKKKKKTYLHFLPYEKVLMTTAWHHACFIEKTTRTFWSMKTTKQA